ncbi:DUF4221 family protein [Algoriphagus namhaensis]|uniref:DUF4221 family protein n=1 Tax=Algoriphagus namhaensis TaxID=915353 RepID=A0ABV8AT96_9BACT
MKKLLLLPLLALLFSCGGNEGGEESASPQIELTYEIDTVMVDAGDHFFFLNYGLGMSSLSTDAKLLYNLNPQALLLEVIDLDALALKETIQLEREGPNGVGGGFISGMQVLANRNLKFFDFNSIMEVNPAGELVDKFEYVPSEWEGYQFNEDEEEFRYSGVFTPDGRILYTTIAANDYTEPAKGIAKLNFDTKQIEFFEMGDMFDRLDRFAITMQSDNMSMSAGESINLNEVKGDLLIGNSAFNELFVLKSGADSLIHHTFTSGLTRNEKTMEAPNTVESQEDFRAAMKKRGEQVSFGKMIYHPEEDLFWRFTSDKDRMIADSLVKKQVLTIFDSELTMLHEEKIENYGISGRQFFKDGMLYSFLNMGDEMAFVRLKPIFN